MTFDRRRREEILRERAAGYVRTALANITREYPHMPYFVATGPGAYPTHRELHPAFYGCFDWHSCVEMHWVVVRLLRRFPDAVPGSEARATLDELLTAENIAAEAGFFSDPNHRALERPYGWGWLLALSYELKTWDDPDARRWAAALEPLATLLGSNLAEWLTVVTYPQRTGVHQNTAFALSRAYDYAKLRAGQGDDALLATIRAAAGRWFARDEDYPAHYEPSGADFLSPALCEAELMSRILGPSRFPGWLERFLPTLADSSPESLFRPAVVSDPTDGHIAHLHGLNLSRAWAFATLAERLPQDDVRIPPLLAAAERHAAAALPHVTGSDYMVEHWLAAYATLLLS
ncbi:DUF2891 domain-containing protein [Rubrobacter taiwanensis]|uniref:DUF2891 domain-containing protein n=1 Tax=Rubrobacter taiwanensis TaxID=185139 RepID=A0A4R1BM19_9ACTN|nr:DUF2891 domain-containing protein [Rubrobacter taiwanensis]TCJ18348.1 DUF2891 domain-containing protein [Rubrobacter taiwanensis]